MNEFFIELGSYLRKSRKQAGLSQGDVAKELGYATPQFVSNFERGLCAPPLPKLKILIKLFKLSQDEVIGLMLSQQEKYWKKALNDSTEEN